jgi:hypothetical protein
MNLEKMNEKEKKRYYEIKNKLNINFSQIKPIDINGNVLFTIATFNEKTYNIYLSHLTKDDYYVQAAKQIYDKIIKIKNIV